MPSECYQAKKMPGLRADDNSGGEEANHIEITLEDLRRSALANAETNHYFHKVEKLFFPILDN